MADQGGGSIWNPPFDKLLLYYKSLAGIFMNCLDTISHLLRAKHPMVVTLEIYFL